jgi:hypothetical protein
VNSLLRSAFVAVVALGLVPTVAHAGPCEKHKNLKVCAVRQGKGPMTEVILPASTKGKVDGLPCADNAGCQKLAEKLHLEQPEEFACRPSESPIEKYSQGPWCFRGGGEAAAGPTDAAPAPAPAAKGKGGCGGKKYVVGAPDEMPGHGVQSVAVADMNGDGKADIVTGNPHGTKPPPPYHAYVGVTLSKGGGEFADMKLYPVGLNDVPDLASPDLISVGDLNGDGKPDVVFSSPGYGGSDPQYLLNKGNGTLGAQVSLKANSTGGTAIVADLNGDKRNDIALSSYVWINGGKKGAVNFAGKTTFNEPRDDVQAAADFDGDGAVDLVVRETGKGAAVYKNDGNATFSKGASVAVDNALAMGVGDFNGDGKPDLAVLSNKSLAIALNEGKGRLGTPAYSKLPDGFDASSWLVVADLNGDGRADAVVADQYKGLGIYVNDGTGTLGTPSVQAVAKLSQAAAGDFDGTGVLSLVVVDDSQSSDEAKSHVWVLPGSCR